MSAENRPVILIADDDDSIRFPLVGILEDHGFKVLEASGESELLKKAPSAQLWIIDVRLPTRNYEGLLAVSSLARSKIRSKYPVLFISVDAEDYAKDQLDGLRRQNIEFEWLEKPFELELLLDKIQDWIK